MTVQAPRAHVTRRRAWWIAAAVGTAVVLTMAVVIYLRWHRSTGWIGLAAGRYRGHAWHLYAEEQQGQLCMELAPPGEPGRGEWAGGCGFNRDHPDSGYFMSGLGPGNSLVSFGPVPTAATAVRVATNQLIQTRPLPSPLPSGRYWLEFLPESGSLPAGAGKALWPRPLDAGGQRVAWRSF